MEAFENYKPRILTPNCLIGLGGKVLDVMARFSFLPQEVLSRGDHNSGGAPFLDEQLRVEEQGRVGEQLSLDIEG